MPIDASIYSQLDTDLPLRLSEKIQQDLDPMASAQRAMTLGDMMQKRQAAQQEVGDEQRVLAAMQTPEGQAAAQSPEALGKFLMGVSPKHGMKLLPHIWEATQAANKPIQGSEYGTYKPDGSVLIPPQAKAQTPTNLSRLYAEYNALPPDTPQEVRTSYKNAIRKESEIAKQIVPGGGGGGSPYYNFIGTPQGIAVGNARTGELSYGNVNGSPVVKSSDSPELQGKIAGAKEGAQAQAKRDFNMAGIGSVIQRAEDVLKGKGGKLPTGSGIGTVVDMAGNLVGVPASGAPEADELRAIGGALTSKMPRMEGPQSDKDTQLYREMAAQVGDSTKTRASRLKALNTVKGLWNKYEKIETSKDVRSAADKILGL